jgi:hypothetical protein
MRASPDSTLARVTRRDRLARAIPVPLTIALTFIAIVEFVFLWQNIDGQDAIGLDYRWFVGVAQHWLDTGEYYVPRQLVGPYHVETLVDVLYPPNALLLFVPFTVLPAFLWWAIPLGVFAFSIVYLRPARWAWPLIALCIAWPWTISQVIYGNTNMWIAGFVAGGALVAWPAVLVLLKPSLLPFALLGIGRRSWWIALAVFVVASLPFGALWLDYFNAMRNSDVSAIRSLFTVPNLLPPVIALLASTHPAYARRPRYMRLPFPRQSQMSTTSPGSSSDR